MTFNTLNTMVLAVAANEPNWMLLLIILGSLAIIAILLLIPSEEMKKLAAKDKLLKLASEEDGEIGSEEVVGDGDGEEDEADEANSAGKGVIEVAKEHMSLSEIKESKRALVGEETSKEELRRLRRERRADTQTEKAIQEREDEAKSESKKSDVTASEAVVAKVVEAVSDVAEKDEDKVDAAEDAKAKEAVLEDDDEEAAEADDEAAETEAEDDTVATDDSAESDDASASKGEDAGESSSDEAKSDASLTEGGFAGVSGEHVFQLAAGDLATGNGLGDSSLFDSLFGEENPSDLSFETGHTDALAGPAFPMLGSKLIPLNELTKQSEMASDDGDLFGNLSSRFSDELAEKKTLN